MIKIGDSIKSFRIKRGMSQKTLASKSGLSVNSIQSYEYGIFTPKIDHLEKIANALNISLYQLLQMNDNAWILFSDRQPPMDKPVLATGINKNNGKPYLAFLRVNRDGVIHGVVVDDIDVEDKTMTAVAWMPLPDPYKG